MTPLQRLGTTAVRRNETFVPIGEKMSVNLKSKTMLVIDNGVFPEFARRLADDFGRVLFWAPWSGGYPVSKGLLIGHGDDKVERIVDPWPYIEDDVPDIYFFGDVYEGALQSYLRSQGKRVFGCGRGAELELDRVKAKQIMAKGGVPIGPYKKIIGVAALRKHLKANKNQFVKQDATRGDFETFHAPAYEQIEPRIDELEHSLGAQADIKEFIVEEGIDDAIESGYDGYSIDGKFPKVGISGIEVKDRAFLGKIMPTKMMPKQVIDVNDSLSGPMKGYQYRGFFSSEVRITKDGKGYPIDLTCFADDTEILTDKGWRLFQDLDQSERVATLNVETGVTEYQQPEDYISYRYDGEMILISNKEKGIECLVTPNHGVWRTDRHGNGLYRERADSLTDKGYIPRVGKWHGHRRETYTIPAYYSSWVSGRAGNTVREYACDPVEIKMEDWLRFVAVYLGDGSSNGYQVMISQTDASNKKSAVEDVISKLPFTWSRNERGFTISSVQLTEHIECGVCNEKRIPEFVKSLSAEQISTFLEAYRLCDGGEHKGQKLYFTTSKGLADDLQELIFKAGRLANIWCKRVAGTPMTVGGKTYTRNHDGYVIAEVEKQNRFWFETGSRADRYLSKVPYSGFVHDVTVPNGTVYVRRNGKPFWSSNCRLGSPPSEVYQEMFKNLAEIVWYGSEGILIEPEYEDTWGAEVLMLSDWADKNWLHVEFPDAIRNNVKLRNLCIINDEHYCVPQLCGAPEVGSVVATGKSAEEAIRKVKAVAEQVKGYNLEMPVEALDEALEDLTEILGPEKKLTPAQRKVKAAYKAGKISDRQYEKMMADE